MHVDPTYPDRFISTGRYIDPKVYMTHISLVDIYVHPQVSTAKYIIFR